MHLHAPLTIRYKFPCDGQIRSTCCVIVTATAQHLAFKFKRSLLLLNLLDLLSVHKISFTRVAATGCLHLRGNITWVCAVVMFVNTLFCNNMHYSVIKCRTVRIAACFTSKYFIIIIIIIIDIIISLCNIVSQGTK
jgi:hypothetical protein